VRHFIDISSVHGGTWQPPRGVTRLEYNVAREALLLGATLVRFDEALQGFVAVELPENFGQARDPVKILLSGTPKIRLPLLKRRGVKRARALGKLLSEQSAAASESEAEKAREELAWLLAHNYEFLPVTERFELAALAHALAPRSLCHRFSYWVMVERAKPSAASYDNPAQPVQFRPGDKLMSLGASWKLAYIEALEKLAAGGVTIVALIYDMIPITHPSFLPSDEVERFETYLARMLKSPIRLTTISRSSQQEIATYCRAKLGLSKDIVVTPLASSASAARAAASTKIIDAGLQNAPFVLMAGSFEPRKNQKFFLDIWRAAVARLSEPPALVFAGGLAKAAYLQELRQDARDLDRAFFFFNVDDEELAWFYENCLFTVFPSEAEGWGLPITEALDRGKYCLASDNTSLKEAGEGLIFHAALQDRQAWLDELHTLLSDATALDARTKRIRETHRTRTWADVTRAMMAL
jgi:glycosyltransferase involved in cell wall biosynthesis